MMGRGSQVLNPHRAIGSDRIQTSSCATNAGREAVCLVGRKRCAYAAAMFISLVCCFSTIAAASEASPTSRPRVGLVLGGGGARGLAHLGVIAELERLYIPIDCIAGTSAGALVGGVYAAGMPIDEMVSKVRSADWDDLLAGTPDRTELPYLRKNDDAKNLASATLGVTKDGIVVGRSLVGSQKIERFLRSLTGGLTIDSFQRLPIPFTAIATDLETGDLVEFRSGDLATALRASMAVPGVFDLVEDQDRILIDGMFARNLPVENVKGVCADVVIAVDVGMPQRKRDSIRSLLDVADQTLSVMTGKNVVASRRLLDQHDLLIEPDLVGYSPASFTDAAAIIERGRTAARNAAAALARYAVDETTFTSWRDTVAANTAPSEPPPPQMSIPPTRYFPQKYIAGVIEGDSPPKTQAELESRLDVLFNTGDFDSIAYRYSREGDTPSTDISIQERSIGPNRLKLGLELEVDTYRSANVAVLANYQMAWLNPSGTRWKNDLRIGSNSEVVSEILQPLTPSSVIGSMRAYARAAEFPVFESSGAKLGEVGTTTAGAEVGLGYLFGSLGEVRGYAFMEHVKTRATSGLADADVAASIGLRGYSLKGVIDQLDNPKWPRRGYYGSLDTTWAKDKDSGASSLVYGTLDLDAATTYSELTVRGSLRLSAASRADSTFGKFHQLGGFLRLSGLETNRIAAAETTLGRVMVYRRLAALLPQLGSGTYVGGSVEAGRAKWLLSGEYETKLVPAASAFIGVDTFLGPLYLALGHANYSGPNWAGYLYLGYRP